MKNLKANNLFFVFPASAGILLFIASMLFSCSSKKFDSKEALWTYLKEKENGYLQEKNINGYDFSLLYKPTDLLVAQELEEDASKERLNALREKYKKQLYLVLSMSRNGKELLSTTPKNRDEFGAMVNQLAFGMRDKVHLFTQQKDTIAMLDYHYPRMYGMSQATTILFVFPRDERNLETASLHFTIQDLGGYTGEVKFKIEIDKIKKEPIITF